MDTKNPFFTRQSLFQKKGSPSLADPSLPNMQIGSIYDANLGNLRETIKNAMIPLLIKVFELKLAAQQTKTPPSRLQKQPKESLDDILQQLSCLLKDLDLLHMWCESSQKQVAKAIKEMNALMQEPAHPERDSLNKVSTEKNSSLPGKEGDRLSWLRKFFSW